MKVISTASQEWQRICARQVVRRRRTEERVRQIVDDVHQNGDEALLRYTGASTKCASHRGSCA